MATGSLTSGYSISFPVLHARQLPNDVFYTEGEVEGTCFSLGNGFMLTAGHVARAIGSGGLSGVVGLAEPSGKRFKAAPVVDIEELPCDLSVIRVAFVYQESASWFHTLRWLRRPLNPFELVRCCGYPYGLHVVEKDKSVVQRAFQGYIVAALDEFKPLIYQGKPFSAYELSFPAPRGLSGAPLLTSAGEPHVTGIVIGNSKASMLVLETEEIERNSTEKKTLQVYESLSLGIAVQATDIYPAVSKLLGGTIGDYLEKSNILV
jgi:hypothetical protein